MANKDLQDAALDREALESEAINLADLLKQGVDANLARLRDMGDTTRLTSLVGILRTAIEDALGKMKGVVELAEAGSPMALADQRRENLDITTFNVQATLEMLKTAPNNAIAANAFRFIQIKADETTDQLAVNIGIPKRTLNRYLSGQTTITSNSAQTSQNIAKFINWLIAELPNWQH